MSQNRHYWRSLEARPQPPDGEFPPGALGAPDRLSRRSMLRLMGASLALAGAASCRRPVEEIVPYVSAPENLIPGVPRRYASLMPLGTEALGVLVESHEGRPTKIEGNPLHPASRGAASAWMQASLLDLYDPDRPRLPLRRSGVGELETSSWAEFQEFWSEHGRSLETRRGEGLALLTVSHSSPTRSRLVRQFLNWFPQARHVTWEAVGDHNIFEGIHRATGEWMRPVPDLNEASVILSLEADFLLTETASVSQARDFARGRRPDRPEGINRLYCVESTLSVTGAAADHRIALPSRQVGAFLLALAARLEHRGLILPEVEAERPGLGREVEERIDLIARDLMKAGPQALIVAGRRQPAPVHALTLALNLALGAEGRTVSYCPLPDVAWPREGELRSLVEQMHAGAIDTLIVLGGNPAYEAPADLEMAAALERVSQVVQLASHANETSGFAHWLLPQSHYLESWGDARAFDGSGGVIQPLIAPLFDSRSVEELLHLLVEGAETSGYVLVRETWLRQLAGGEDFENRWRRTLHDGVFPTSRPALQNAQLKPLNPIIEELRDSTPEAGLEVTFQVSAAVYDGRFANNAWLQELPDPITKITWDNAALLSPQDARRERLSDGDVVRLSLGGRSMELPVRIVPGQSSGSVAVTLGYGRRRMGRVAEGTGGNAYLLRRSGRLDWDAGLELEKTGRRHHFAETQEHGQMEGRAPVRELDLDGYRSESDSVEPAPAPLWKEHEYTEGYQWGMAIDLNVCTGCNACVVACQSENNIPVVGREQVALGREMHWLRIDRYFSGPPENPQVVHQPVACMHCENAPCEQVCPVGATVHDREGLNAMVYNRCIGTRYCSNNCPYKVRRFNFFNFTRELPELVQLAMNPDVTVRSRGVMEKCTFCVQRINAARIAAQQEGRPIADEEILTACQQTCPSEAIVFGNINDPESRVARMKKQGRNYELLSNLNTRPRTSYLARVRNPHPDWPEEGAS